MNPKDIMQASVLKQNIFFSESTYEDISGYKLTKPQRISTTFMDKSNQAASEKGKKKNNQIQPLRQKIKDQSVNICLSFAGHAQGIPEIDSRTVDEQSIRNQQLDVSQQQPIQPPKSQNNPLLCLTDRETQFTKDPPLPIKQQLQKGSQKYNQSTQPKQTPPIGSSFIQAATEYLPQNKTPNLCLFLNEDSDSDSNEENTNKENFKQIKTTFQKKNIKNKINFNTSKIRGKLSFAQSASKKQAQPTKQTPNIQQTSNQKINMQKSKFDKNLQILITQQVINNYQQKNKVLLINFDNDEGEESSSNQQEQTNLQTSTNKNLNSIKHSRQQTAQKQQLKNVFLKDFGQSSSQDFEQSFQTGNRVLLKHSSHSISSNQQLITLTRTISILEFSRLTSTQSCIYQPVPPNYIFQTIVKRYQQQNQNNIVYEMFDQATFKSILKVKKVSEGFEIFSAKDMLTLQWNGNSKNLPRLSQETSCGLLCSNFFGTQFNCFKFNRNNEKPDCNKLNRLITVGYETNIFGLNGPRKMEVYIPSVNYLVRGQKTLRQVHESQKQQNSNQKSKIEHFVNLKPKWNSEIGGFVLNFNGRATVSSVKNFIITRPKCKLQTISKANQSLILFGKMQTNVFNLDIKHPFNMVQGLALALSSFDKKIACQ